MNERLTQIFGLIAGMIGLGTTGVDGHALAVDVDMSTPEIQSSIGATPGTVLTVGIFLIDDGFSVLSGFGYALNFNDESVLAPVSSTIAGPLATGKLDVVNDSPTSSAGPLSSEGLSPTGTGPGGPFTSSDGGAGFYDAFGDGFFGIGPYGGTAGDEVLLTTIDLEVVGSGGSTTNLVPVGILPAGGGPGAPADPKSVASLMTGGVAFWDGEFSFGPGGYAAAPVGASSLSAAINPGTILVIPEPGVALLLLGSFAGFLRLRRS